MATPIATIGTLSITPWSVTIPWTTDQPSACQLEYGVTASYGTLLTQTSVPNIRGRVEWWTTNSARFVFDGDTDTLTAGIVQCASVGHLTRTVTAIESNGVWVATCNNLDPATTYIWQAIGADEDGITWYISGEFTTDTAQAPIVGDIEVNSGQTDAWIAWRTDVSCDTSNVILIGE